MSRRIAWYDAHKGDVHAAVSATVGEIKRHQNIARLYSMHYLDLYSAGNVTGLHRSLGDISSYYSGSVHGMRGARFNMIAAVCDTAHSLIAATPPVPVYITSGTDLGVVRKAAKRSKVLQSQFNELAMAPSREAYHLACRQGTGCIFGYLDEENMPRLEVVNMLELMIDYHDGIYRAPRSVHREKYMHREVLAALYPSKRSQIDKASTTTPDYITRFDLSGGYDQGDMVTVWESWHKGASIDKPGRHVISCSACDLLDETWDEADFPFAFVRYRNRARGFFGAGLGESVRDAQERVNQLIARVAKAQDLASNLMIFNPAGENMLDARWLSNEIGMVFDYDPGLGVPELVKWDGTLGDLQQQIDLEFQRVLAAEGLSESQVTGEGAGKGLTSGVAVRAQDDVMSRRLVNPIELFQQFNIDVARLIERLNDRAAEIDEAYEARGFQPVAGVNFMRTSRWAELEIEPGQACLNMMPMSLMPTTPAGKWAAVSEWLQNGFLEKPTAMKLLQFPALDETAALETAQLDLAMWQMEKLLDGEPVLPEPRQDLALCLQLGTNVWAQAQMMAPSDEVQAALDDYLEFGQMLLDKATQPEAPALPGGAPGMAPGMPGAPPAPPLGGVAPAPAALPGVPQQAA